MKTRILAAGIIVALAMSAAESGTELFQKAVTAERAAGNLESKSPARGEKTICLCMAGF